MNQYEQVQPPTSQTIEDVRVPDQQDVPLQCGGEASDGSNVSSEKNKQHSKTLKSIQQQCIVTNISSVLSV